MKNQIKIFKEINKIMSLTSMVDDYTKKSIQCSLQRKNFKLKSQFDPLFEFFFEKNSNLKKLMPEDNIQFLKKSIHEYLIYNGFDYIIYKDKNVEEKEEMMTLSMIAIGIILNISSLQSIYIEKKVIPISNANKLFGNIFECNLENLLSWFLNETPFKEIKNIKEQDLLESDLKNISNWKKGINIISVKKIISIRDNLKDIVEFYNLINCEDYIDFFIFNLYLETCKQRLVRRIDSLCDGALTKFNSIIKLFTSTYYKRILEYFEKLEIAQFLENLIFSAYGEDFFTNMVIQYKTEALTKSYKNILDPYEIKYPDYRIKEGSLQETSIFLVQILENNASQIFDLLVKGFQENPDIFKPLLDICNEIKNEIFQQVTKILENEKKTIVHFN